MVTIDVDGLDEVNRKLAEYARRGNNLTPVLADIGEHMVNSVQDNFESSTAPDGTPWETNSPVTFASLLGKSHHNKDGRINKRGVNKVMSKQPLIGATRALSGGIHYQTASREVTIGTNAVYGAMMHYGGSKSAFPHLWGDIPARPYLGFKVQDEQIIKEMVIDWVMS